MICITGPIELYHDSKTLRNDEQPQLLEDHVAEPFVRVCLRTHHIVDGKWLASASQVAVHRRSVRHRPRNSITS